MCVVSMVMDHKYDEWHERYIQPFIWPKPVPALPDVPVPVLPSMPTQAEIDEFRRLLERAREYDRKNGEPDCELEEKRQKLRELAKQLGVEIAFV